MPTMAPFVVVGSRRHQTPAPTRVIAAVVAIGVMSLALVGAAVRSAGGPDRHANPILPAATWLVGDPPVQALVKLETAVTADERRLGLAFRPEVAYDSGMAFVMPRPAREALDGRDLKVPLDLVYVGPDWRVSSVERLNPGSGPIPSRSRVALAIEVPAGTARDNGFVVGALVGRMPALDENVMVDIPDTSSSPGPTPDRSVWDRY